MLRYSKKMLFCYYKFVCIAGFLQLCYCQRRLVSGIDSIVGKKYMVYFVQSPFTRNFQNSWVCGGAIVTPTQILTAATCLIEAENIYAIAGYKKYLTAEDIDRDECTRTKKQRVVKILIPTGYNLEYENPAQLKNIDIGVAVVEKPYNFNDLSYFIHCSYEPQPILVNFEKIHEIKNSRAVALGWGVRGKTPEFTKETKYQALQETSTMIVDKEKCTTIADTKEIVQLIAKYHLCGTINLQEVTEDSVLETLSFDAYKHRKSGSKRDNSGYRDTFEYRRGYNEEDNSEPRDETEKITLETQIDMSNSNNYDTRKTLHPNICQNNLGSPLIKWIHDREVIIGITSNTNINGECHGPFLYVSTAASSIIIKCLLETNSLTRKLCNKKISDEPYEIQEIDIMWPNYNQSKILEPMLLIQRAVLDKLSPLIPRATVKYTNPGTFNAEKNLNQKMYKRAQALEKYAHKRAQLGPLLNRPQYDIDVKNQKEQQQKQKEQQSEELSPTEYYAKRQFLKPQSPPLLQRPQFDIDNRYQEQHDQAVSDEFASTQQEFLRPQYNLQLEHQYQPLKNDREFKPDYQQEYTLSENQKYQSPSYNQYDSQKQQQHSPQQDQNNEKIPEGYYSLIREQFKPQVMQIYGSPIEEQHNPPREHQYYPPSKQQEHEPPVRLQQKVVTNQEQYEPQPDLLHGLPSPPDVKYNPLSEYQNNPSPKHQHKPPIPVEHDLTVRQEHAPVYGPSQSEPNNVALGYHQQSKPQDNPHVYQPPTLNSGHSLEHHSIGNKPIKPKLEQPALLYDFSPELHFGESDLTPNQPQKSAQSPISLQKQPAQLSKSQPNSQPHKSQLESSYQKLLAQNNTTTPSDDDSFSFDEIFAQLQNLPSESQTTVKPELTQKEIFKQVLQDRTFDGPYKENDQPPMYNPRVEVPLPQDEVLIRPQIPMNNQYVVN